MKKVTVIIPVYNQEELVIKALKSIPDREDIEIIVVDDGSSDFTWNSLMKYRVQNTHLKSHIVYIRNAKNKGVSYSINKALDIATGEYVVLLGSDDYFYTDRFLEVMEELGDYDLVFFDLEINDGTILTSNEKKQLDGSVKFMRREFIGNTRNREDKKAGEDYYFYMELLKKNPRIKYTNIVAKHYNYPREGSLSYLVLQGEIEGSDKSEKI